MIENLKGCFSKERINTGRQTELDMAKGFAIIFMVWVHITETFVGRGYGIMPQIVENFLGGPFAAPVFMICMGIEVVYSKKREARDFLKRGLSLLLIGFVLDLFRNFMPEFLFMVVAKDFTWISDAFYSLISVDILQFAGLHFCSLPL